MKEMMGVARKFSILIFIPVLVIAPTSFVDPINWPKQILLLTILPFLLFETFKNLRPIIHKRSIEISLFSISIALVLFSSLLNFQNISTTLWGTWGRNNGLVTYICLILIAFVFSYLVRIREFAEIFIKSYSLCLIPATIYGLIQLGGFDPFDWSVKNAVFSFFGNTNFASAIFSLSALASILILTYFKVSNMERIFYFGQAIGSTIVMFSTNSIQGPVALGIGLALMGYFLLGRINQIIAKAYLVLGILAGIILFLSFLGSGPLGSSLYQYTLKLRTFYWLAGLKMGASSPIYGVGVDSYGDFYRQNRSIDTIQATSIDLTVSNAHNSAIQLFATMGLLGLTSYLLIFLPGLLFLSKSLTRNSFKNSPTTISILILFSSSFAISMISIDNIAVAVLTWSLAGACFGLYFQSLTKRELTIHEFSSTFTSKKNLIRLKKLDSIKPLVLTLSTALAFGLPWYSSTVERKLIQAYKQPYATFDQTEKDKFIGQLFNFSNSFPLIQGYQMRLIIQIIERDPNYRIIAESVGKAAIEKFPLEYSLLDSTAVASENLGRWQEALEIRERQLEIDTRHPKVRAYLARDLIQLQRISEARKEISISRQWAIKFSDQATLNYLRELETLID